MIPQKSIRREITLRVAIDDLLSLVTRQLNELSVSCDVRDLQVKGNATLLSTLQVAGPAQLQVSLSNGAYASLPTACS